MARFVSTQPKVLILDEPTKGIDVGAKAEMYKTICALTKEGISVIFISSELPADSSALAAFCCGRITGELMCNELSEERLLSCALKISSGGS